MSLHKQTANTQSWLSSARRIGRLSQFLGASLVVLGLGASSANAQSKAKNSRTVDVKVDVKISDRVKPPAPKEQGKAAAPQLTADSVLAIEGLVGEIRAEQVAILTDLIANTDDREVDEKADYYFRLGEIYAKQQRFYRIKSADEAIAADSLLIDDTHWVFWVSCI